jgi:hypothetical protein
MALEDYKKGIVYAGRFLYPYFSLLNLYLLFSYAFRDVTYTFLQALQYHFLFYYAYMLLPLFLAIIVGKRLLYTEYPKLAYILMPIVAIAPYVLFSSCSFVSCQKSIFYVLMAITLILSIKFSSRLMKEHGDYMVFQTEEKNRKLVLIFFTIINIITFFSIPFLTDIHTKNEAITRELDSIEPSQLKTQCGKIIFSLNRKAICLNHVALAQNDITICKKIRWMIVENENADNCYKNIASLNDNIEICNNILFKDIKYSCYDEFRPLDDSLCAKIEDEQYRLGCIKDCSSLTEQKQKDSCYLVRASEDTTTDLCASISQEAVKDVCYERYLEKATTCEQILATSYKDTCYSNLATAQKNISQCYTITNTQLKERCITFTSASNADCQAIQSPRMRDVCKANHAAIPEECEEFSFSLAKDTCYNAIAQKTNDNRLCAKILDVSAKTVCEHSFS